MEKLSFYYISKQQIAIKSNPPGERHNSQHENPSHNFQLFVVQPPRVEDGNNDGNSCDSNISGLIFFLYSPAALKMKLC